MPLEQPTPPLSARVAELNAEFAAQSTETLLARCLDNAAIGRLALVSSFGVDSIVLLDMIARLDRNLPVLFIDTELLFAETLSYQRQVADRLGLGDLRVLRPGRETLFHRDPDGMLRVFHPDACCDLRKRQPLERGLRGFDAWISGRKRFQGGQRQNMPLFEVDPGAGDSPRLKINPLANWQPQDLRAYIRRHDLPLHPLTKRGFSSLGCRPCTTPTKPGEAPRAGRWRGLPKTECGLHLPPPEGRER